MTTSTSQHVLLLNADFTPYKVILWRRAVELLLEERVELIEGYVDRFVRSARTSMPWPAVLRLKQYIRPKARMRFNRQNVLARDEYTCAYCGVSPRKKDGRPRIEELSLDHVVPRAQSKNGQVRCHKSLGKDTKISVTCWENVVCCCVDCNIDKANRTPEQAGKVLRFAPRTPTMMDVLRMTLRRVEIPDEWVAYLPEGAAHWSGYWTDDLEEE
jgi:5-methylcytosine-specific restriction endonuclease McrA